MVDCDDLQRDDIPNRHTVKMSVRPQKGQIRLDKTKLPRMGPRGNVPVGGLKIMLQFPIII